MRNIFLINKLVDNLFENKIHNLLLKYSNIQAAYHTIQTKTVLIILFLVNIRSKFDSKQIFFL